MNSSAFFKNYALLACFVLLSGGFRACAQGSAVESVDLKYEDSIRNAPAMPDLLYWFVTPQTLPAERYERDIQHISHDTYFDFPFLTARNGVNFSDSPAAHATIAGIVRQGHQNGLRIGATLEIQEVDRMRKFPLDDDQTVIGEGEGSIDPNGHANVETTVKLRYLNAVKTELLRVYVFRKTAPGEYDPATLTEVTAQAKATSPQAGTMDVTVDLGVRYAGYSVFAMTTSWFNSLDRFSPAFTSWIHEAVDQYKDVALDGTALDEFGFMRVLNKPTSPLHGHFAGKAFAEQFQAAKAMNLTDTLFATRYAPSGHPETRIRAIDQYWDFFRTGPLRDEQEFFQYSRKIFGDTNFAGIHDTYHNHLINDEVWATGLNWWTVPRHYGMSDEDLSLPMRMGLLVAHPGNLMYDQFYGRDIHRFATKAMNDARFDARLHYHGYNDTGVWGVDLSLEPFLASQNPVERKIRLLNRFDPAAPELPLLVVFGMPSLLNWYPDEAARNLFDVNGSLHIEEKVIELWNAGYRCAVVPSDLIDSGAIQLDALNRPTLNGHTFRAIIYLYPQYAKPSTLAFFNTYVEHGGPLMLEGTANRDFDGKPLGATFDRIAARARVKGFSLDRVSDLGIAKSPLDGIGGELEDGSVILTDLESLEVNTPKAFSVKVNGHQFSGAYIGVLAIKAAADGRIEKFACGSCMALSRDGREILHLRTPADLLLIRSAEGSLSGVLEGPQGSNLLKLTR